MHQYNQDMNCFLSEKDFCFEGKKICIDHYCCNRNTNLELGLLFNCVEIVKIQLYVGRRFLLTGHFQQAM